MPGESQTAVISANTQQLHAPDRLSWPRNAIRAGISRQAPRTPQGDTAAKGAVTSLHIWDPLCPRKQGRESVGAKLSDHFAEDSMEEGFHDTPCIMWQVRGQLSGWCSPAILIGCGAVSSRGIKPCQGGDSVHLRSLGGTRKH